MTRAPTFYDRPDFIGSADDYKWLAAWFGYTCVVTPAWRGTGTALLVLSKDGEPLRRSELVAFRKLIEEWRPINSTVTVVSVA